MLRSAPLGPGLFSERLLGDTPLLTVPTEDTGGSFGDRSQPRRGNRLSTFLTEAVLAAEKALERLGELIRLFDEGAPGLTQTILVTLSRRVRQAEERAERLGSASTRL